MHSKLVRLALLIMVCLVVFPLVAVADVSGKAGLTDTVAARVENGYIGINMSIRGIASVGTTGGEPAQPGDDEKPLLYGYRTSSVSDTGYPTLRLVRNGSTQDYVLRDIATTTQPGTDSGAVVATWLIDGVQVVQRVSLSQNPFTGRPDMAMFSFTLKNQSAEAVQAGLRLMLDLQVGGNDYAPLLVPDTGRLSTETDFGSGLVFFRAFESSTYAADSLRALGILKGYGLTDPDRVVLATWVSGRGDGNGIVDYAWDYAITPGGNVGDSAMAYWWNPETLAPGQSVTYKTQYGLGTGGGQSWIDAPAAVSCNNNRFTATLWVSNTSLEPLTNGVATLMLPAGISLVSGSATEPFGDVPADGAASHAWLLEADTSSPMDFNYAASVTFDYLGEPLTSQASINVPDCSPAATVTPAPTTGPTAAPTAGPSPTPAPTPAPEVPEPGSLTLLLVGLGGLTAAWKRRARSR